MFSEIESLDDSFHNIFDNGDWNLEKITNDFGDTPTILTRVLQRRSCSVEVVKLLLNHGADINCQDEQGYSPLMIAVGISNDEVVIRELLEAGADVNKVDGGNRTPLSIFLQREDCSDRILEVLLDFNADVNHKDKYGVPPLKTAIRKSKGDSVIQALVKRGALVTDSGNLHNSALFLLLRQAKNYSVDTVKILIAELDYFNINRKDILGDTPLVTALAFERDEAVIQALLEKGADVNVPCRSDHTPLMFYLRRNFNRDIMKFLNSFDTKFNYDKDFFRETPRSRALGNDRDEAIIKMLLESGADVNRLSSSDGRSPLCLAFTNYPYAIVKLLLDAGASPNACTFHMSALHCATDYSYSGLREDILKLLIEANNNVNCVSSDGQSVLCYALQHGAKVNDIQLLLDAGASLNSCAMHLLPLKCATSVREGTPLSGDVIKLLLDHGAGVEGEDLIVLQNALLSSVYDTRAIQLLLELPGMDAYVMANELLLHHAVRNPNCRPDVVKLLINQKAQVLSLDALGNTSLHCAVSNGKCNASVINLLLKSGSPVNAMTIFGRTPLSLAVGKQFQYNILRELLLAGADIVNVVISRSYKNYALLEYLAHEWEHCKNPQVLSCFELLVKFFLLQNPLFNIKNFLCHPDIKTLRVRKMLLFFNKSFGELGKMNSLQVSHGQTFLMFVSKDSLSLNRNYDVDQIVMHLTKNTFPVFFDVVCSRIGRSIMEEKVQKIWMYTNKINSMEQINLNCDIVNKIAGYLPDEDLLKFIVASYKPVNEFSSEETSKDNTLLGKRNSEQLSQCHKHPKLFD